MKPKKIEWSNTIFGESHNGLINKIAWFEVRPVGKKNPKYLLLTYPIMNPNFTRANNSKKIDEFDTVELAKEKAQKIFDELVNSLTE
jgi:hypothetical protein